MSRAQASFIPKWCYKLKDVMLCVLIAVSKATNSHEMP